MAKWHVSPHDGVARKCSASKKACDYAHAESESGAYELNEQMMAAEGHDAFSTVKKLENPNDPSVRNQFIGRDLQELINIQKVYIEDYNLIKADTENLEATRKPGDMLPKETTDKIRENKALQGKILRMINQVGYATDLADGTRSATPEPIKYVDQKFNAVQLYLENQGDKFHPASDELYEAVKNSKNKEDTLQAIRRYVEASPENPYHEHHHEKLRNYINDDSYYD